MPAYISNEILNRVNVFGALKRDRDCDDSSLVFMTFTGIATVDDLESGRFKCGDVVVVSIPFDRDNNRDGTYVLKTNGLVVKNGDVLCMTGSQGFVAIS